jgi:hypothetical protein
MEPWPRILAHPLLFALHPPQGEHLEGLWPPSSCTSGHPLTVLFTVSAFNFCQQDGLFGKLRVLDWPLLCVWTARCHALYFPRSPELLQSPAVFPHSVYPSPAGTGSSGWVEVVNGPKGGV